MKLPRRQFLHMAASVVALPVTSSIASAQARTLPEARPLANRLADYADSLRYDDLDAATVERVKSHVIDTLGCGIAAFDEAPVRICRDLALAPADGVSTVIGTKRRSTPELASFANGAAFRYYDLNDTYASALSERFIRATMSRPVWRSPSPSTRALPSSSPRSFSHTKLTVGCLTPSTQRPVAGICLSLVCRLSHLPPAS
jgi:MmgE/PrpD N-terminal domain